MAGYKLRIFKKAQHDFNEIIEYLNTLSPTAATEYYDRLTEKIGSLRALTERCPQVRDIELKARGYRFLVVENYIVFFVVKGETVQIRRVLYARRQFDWLL